MQTMTAVTPTIAPIIIKVFAVLLVWEVMSPPIPVTPAVPKHVDPFGASPDSRTTSWLQIFRISDGLGVGVMHACLY